jgi:hypothetical protein
MNPGSPVAGRDEVIPWVDDDGSLREPGREIPSRCGYRVLDP